MDTIVLEKDSSVVSLNDLLSYVNHSSTESTVLENSSTVFVTLTSTETVLVENKEATIVVAGQLGPPGKDGISEENMVYSKRVDFVDDNTMYKGESVPGTGNSALGWRISKIVISPTDGDVDTLWADGTANFDKIWSNRLTYLYS